MNLTLFGYPQTGKSTLLHLLTGGKAPCKHHDEREKEPISRIVSVHDPRLEKLSSLYPGKKKVFPSTEIIDLGGFSYGEIKTSSFLNHLRKADGLVHVVRAFNDSKVPHPKGRISPREDIEMMDEELLLADLITVETRLEKLEKDLKKAKDPDGLKEKEILGHLHSHLAQGKGIRELVLSEQEEKTIRSYALLTQKPILYAINIDEKDISALDNPGVIFSPHKKGTEVLAFWGKIESEILELEGDEKKVFLEEYGIKELTAPRFFRLTFSLLDIVSFFTIGKEEIRGWTIKSHTPAIKAAGAIHSDIEKGFIKAEVIPWDVLIAQGSLQAAKEKGVIRLEGKDYPVQDGDVVYFRFSP